MSLTHLYGRTFIHCFFAILILFLSVIRGVTVFSCIPISSQNASVEQWHAIVAELRQSSQQWTRPWEEELTELKLHMFQGMRFFEILDVSPNSFLDQLQLTKGQLVGVHCVAPMSPFSSSQGMQNESLGVEVRIELYLIFVNEFAAQRHLLQDSIFLEHVPAYKKLGSVFPANQDQLTSQMIEKDSRKHVSMCIPFSLNHGLKFIKLCLLEIIFEFQIFEFLYSLIQQLIYLVRKSNNKSENDRFCFSPKAQLCLNCFKRNHPQIFKRVRWAIIQTLIALLPTKDSDGFKFLKILYTGVLEELQKRKLWRFLRFKRK